MELILYSIGFCLFLVCLLVFIIIYSKRVVVNGELVKKQIEVDHQKQLTVQLIEVQEEERSRIARDLHDGINAKLATVILQASKVEDTNRSELIMNSIKGVMDISRNIAYELLPPTLEGFGISVALSELFEPIIEDTIIDIELDLPLELEELEVSKHLHTYRIIQELLQNSLKHAQASKICLSGRIEAGLLKLRYSDNGLGKDLTTINSNGLGLRNIEMRAKMMNGKCVFSSKEGKGFTAEIQVKLVE